MRLRTRVRKWYSLSFCLLITYCMHARRFAEEAHASSSRWTRHLRISHCLNTLLFIYDCFDLDRSSRSFHLACRLARMFDTTSIHSTSISVSHSSRIRWRNENELRDELTNLKRRILRYEFYRTWCQKISREERRWHFVSDQKEHCFSDVFKIIVAKASSLKREIVSRFQRKLSDSSSTDLNLCQVWSRTQFYIRFLWTLDILYC